MVVMGTMPVLQQTQMITDKNQLQQLQQLKTVQQQQYLQVSF